MSTLIQQLNAQIHNVQQDSESKDYNGHQFSIGNKKIIFRTAKITPKKAGLFVTFWKRSTQGPIEPFKESDNFDFFLVEISSPPSQSFFLFPKSILTSKKIISTPLFEGKRAFRVYPPSCKKLNKTATSTQKWQLNFFHSDKTEILTQLKAAKQPD